MLNEQQLKAIKDLQNKCENEENIQLKLNWEILQARKENVTRDFFHYENDVLVGYLAIYPFGNKYEICGMVHPENRGAGIFSALFQEAMKEIPSKAAEILINAPAKSHSAKRWLKNYPATYDFSEYEMKWMPTELKLRTDFIQLRKATEDDFETKVKLDVACFGFDESGARDFNKNENSKKITYMIDVNEETIGKIGITRENGESYIYGFAVFPRFQGKGYGRVALTQTVIGEEKTGNDILLEVAAENKHALTLYENCGFQSYEVQDYYQYKR